MKIRISKTTWIILGAGVFAMCLVVLAMTYRWQLNDQTQLKGRLAMAQKQASSFQIAQLTTKQADLTAQLAQSDQRAALALSNLTQVTDVIEISDTLYQMAERNKLVLSAIQTVGGGKETIEKVPCDTLKLNITAEGGIFDLQRFVLDIIEQFPTSVIKTMNISAAKDESSFPTVRISLVIYTYGGS